MRIDYVKLGEAMGHLAGLDLNPAELTALFLNLIEPIRDDPACEPNDWADVIAAFEKLEKLYHE